jgi:hypothetical protein
LVGWKKQMHQYDAVKRNPVISPSFRKTFFYVFLFLFLGFSLLMAFLPYISSHAAHLLNDQTLYPFVSGTLVLMWGFYFQLIYWEKKNHMKMYMKKEKGQQKLYVLGEKGENYELGIQLHKKADGLVPDLQEYGPKNRIPFYL